MSIMYLLYVPIVPTLWVGAAPGRNCVFRPVVEHHRGVYSLGVLQSGYRALLGLLGLFGLNSSILLQTQD